MCFLGNGAVRHCTGLKALYDGIDTLNFIDWDAAVLIEIKIDQASQVDGLLLLIEHMAVLFEDLIISGPCRLLQQMNGARIVQMLLLAGTLLVTSHTFQRQIYIQSQRVKCSGMQHIHVVCDVF